MVSVKGKPGRHKKYNLTDEQIKILELKMGINENPLSFKNIVMRLCPELDASSVCYDPRYNRLYQVHLKAIYALDDIERDKIDINLLSQPVRELIIELRRRFPDRKLYDILKKDNMIDVWKGGRDGINDGKAAP